MTRPAYMIVAIDVHDSDAFGRYAVQVAPLIQEYGGEVLAATHNYRIEHGAWPRQRVALIRFPSLAQAEGFYHAPAYQPMKSLRESASEADLLLAESPQDQSPEAPEDGATPHYLLGATTVTSSDWIEEYMQKVPPISAHFGVQGLAMGSEYSVLEGAWPRDGLVLLRFPSEAVFQAFWYGDEYRAMKDLREANTVADHISFAGVIE